MTWASFMVGQATADNPDLPKPSKPVKARAVANKNENYGLPRRVYRVIEGTSPISSIAIRLRFDSTQPQLITNALGALERSQLIERLDVEQTRRLNVKHALAVNAVWYRVIE